MNWERWSQPMRNSVMANIGKEPTRTNKSWRIWILIVAHSFRIGLSATDQSQPCCDGSSHWFVRVNRECVERINRAYAVSMALTDIDQGWTRQRPTDVGRRGPWCGLLCAVWDLNKTTQGCTGDLTRQWAEGPANYLLLFMILLLPSASFCYLLLLSAPFCSFLLLSALICYLKISYHNGWVYDYDCDCDCNFVHEFDWDCDYDCDQHY